MYILFHCFLTPGFCTFLWGLLIMAFQVDNSALTGESMPEPRHNKTEPVGKPGKMGKG